MRITTSLRVLALATFLAGPSGLLALDHADLHGASDDHEPGGVPCPICQSAENPGGVPGPALPALTYDTNSTLDVVPVPGVRSATPLSRRSARPPPASS